MNTGETLQCFGILPIANGSVTCPQVWWLSFSSGEHVTVRVSNKLHLGRMGKRRPFRASDEKAVILIIRGV
jgi:hypothetical protein